MAVFLENIENIWNGICVDVLKHLAKTKQAAHQTRKKLKPQRRIRNLTHCYSNKIQSYELFGTIDHQKQMRVSPRRLSNNTYSCN